MHHQPRNTRGGLLVFFFGLPKPRAGALSRVSIRSRRVSARYRGPALAGCPRKRLRHGGDRGRRPRRRTNSSKAASRSPTPISAKMLEWARSAAVSDSADAVGEATAPARRDDDLLELYCGNGNFTIAMAPMFRAVLATEVSKVRWRRRSSTPTQTAGNVAFARLSSEELTLALDQGKRSADWTTCPRWRPTTCGPCSLTRRAPGWARR